MHSLFRLLSSCEEGGIFPNFSTPSPSVDAWASMLSLPFVERSEEAEEAGERAHGCARARRHGRYKRETKLISQDY